jgi:hypothetical protein
MGTRAPVVQGRPTSLLTVISLISLDQRCGPQIAVYVKLRSPGISSLGGCVETPFDALLAHRRGRRRA